MKSLSECILNNLFEDNRSNDPRIAELEQMFYSNGAGDDYIKIKGSTLILTGPTEFAILGRETMPTLEELGIKEIDAGNNSIQYIPSNIAEKVARARTIAIWDKNGDNIHFDNSKTKGHVDTIVFDYTCPKRKIKNLTGYVLLGGNDKCLSLKGIASFKSFANLKSNCEFISFRLTSEHITCKLATIARSHGWNTGTNKILTAISDEELARFINFENFPNLNKIVVNRFLALYKNKTGDGWVWFQA